MPDTTTTADLDQPRRERPDTPIDLAALSEQLNSMSDEDLERLASSASLGEQQSVVVAPPTTGKPKRNILRSTMSYLNRGKQSQASSESSTLPPMPESSALDTNSTFLKESLPQIAPSAEGDVSAASDSDLLQPGGQKMSKRISVMASGIRKSIMGGVNGKIVLGGVVVDDKVRKEVGEMFQDLDIDLKL
ncbi:hypothetical protein HDU80_001789 [Chytriomyces hyalinus]|nr:hypothetical protein HDU80_001789 [Chytriomyces hyalinus]